MADFVKVPCKHCPFRRDVTPFLHPDRAAEIASVALNPYSSVTCHKTLEFDEETGEPCLTDKSLECAGMLSLRANEGYGIPNGFEPSELVYNDWYEMVDAYQEEWDSKHEVRHEQA